jgi:hypothetical protein
MRTILIIILILLLIGALPTWPYSSGWGYYPSGGPRPHRVDCANPVVGGSDLKRPKIRTVPIRLGEIRSFWQRHEGS